MTRPNPRLLDPPVEAVAEWLLMSAPWGVARAREEWETEGVTPLRCGGMFCALRVPVPLVEAVAGETDPPKVDAVLREVLNGAPSFRCNLGCSYYVLVRPTVAAWWDGRTEVECIGRGLELGVPRPDFVGYPGYTVSYWAVPMTRPSQLGCGEDVTQMVSYGRVLMGQEGTPWR